MILEVLDSAPVGWLKKLAKKAEVTIWTIFNFLGSNPAACATLAADAKALIDNPSDLDGWEKLSEDLLADWKASQ